jgi:single-stranded-DNA-specific exonuclease
VNQKNWQENRPDAGLQSMLARELEIHPITAAILIQRGIRTVQDGRRFLQPSFRDLLDPFLLPDMDRAVERIRKAVKNRESVVIYGDYDVDGMTAIALYYEWFIRQDCNVRYYIPHRINEGYGLHQKAIRDLHDQGVKLLITADCGTTSVQEIRLARTLGLDVIITDHHEVPTHLDGWPPAYAMVNPKRPDSKYTYDGLCTAGLAYKVIQALNGENEEWGVESRTTPDSLRSTPSNGLDLVALGTLADVSPVVGENRYLVSEGLKQIGLANRVGIRALKAASGVDGQRIGCGTVGFTLAPRINAVGRLADAHDGVRLLTTRSRQEADQIAANLELWNRKRQRIEQSILEEVERKIAQEVDLAKDPCIVLSSPRWHLGVIGIVASRVVERYGRPAILIALDGEGLGRGSARSIPGFHLQQGLQACAERLLKFGGHKQAAGLTIRKNEIPAFREKLSGVVLTTFHQKEFRSNLTVDAVVELEDLTFPLLWELERLRPHGIGNPEPTFAVREAMVFSPRVVGNNHLKFKVRKHGARTFDAIGFRMGNLAGRVGNGQRVNLAFMPEVQEWRGEQRSQLRIKDLQPI